MTKDSPRTSVLRDEELIARLRDWQEHDEGKINDAREAAADRIEALTKERDQWISHAKNAIWADSEELKEAEAYAEELEKELNTCRMAQAVMDNTVADLEGKLAKAAAFLEEIAITGDWFVSDMNDLIKELKGESQDGMV